MVAGGALHDAAHLPVTLQTESGFLEDPVVAVDAEEPDIAAPLLRVVVFAVGSGYFLEGGTGFQGTPRGCYPVFRSARTCVPARPLLAHQNVGDLHLPVGRSAAVLNEVVVARRAAYGADHLPGPGFVEGILQAVQPPGQGGGYETDATAPLLAEGIVTPLRRHGREIFGGQFFPDGQGPLVGRRGILPAGLDEQVTEVDIALLAFVEFADEAVGDHLIDEVVIGELLAVAGQFLLEGDDGVQPHIAGPGHLEFEALVEIEVLQYALPTVVGLLAVRLAVDVAKFPYRDRSAVDGEEHLVVGLGGERKGDNKQEAGAKNALDHAYPFSQKVCRRGSPRGRKSNHFRAPLIVSRLPCGRVPEEALRRNPGLRAQ